MSGIDPEREGTTLRQSPIVFSSWKGLCLHDNIKHKSLKHFIKSNKEFLDQYVYYVTVRFLQTPLKHFFRYL